MQPILNNILFRPFPSEEMSEGGIIVPDAFKAVNNKGTIVGVGNGTKQRPMRLNEGMVAHRVKDWGQEVMINGELHFLMDDRAIIAVEN